MTERLDQDPRTADMIRELEHQRLGALVSGDIATARALHADDYELISGSGGRVSGDEYLAGIASGELRYAVFEPASTLVVRVYADVAVVRYLARIEIHFASGRDTRQLLAHRRLRATRRPMAGRLVTGHARSRNPRQRVPGR